MATQKAPRLVISAPHGRSGKTTVAIALCRALAGRGLAVQPFKKGPDYIDPSWLSEAAGRPCRTLDPFFMRDAAGVRQAFARGSNRADISLVEGNHGLFDTADETGMGSTAALARSLMAPIILVVDCERMGRSVAALVRGYQEFEKSTTIAGVILNQVVEGRHEGKLRSALERHCGIPVLGAIPRREELRIPDRHLGLVPRSEGQALLPTISAARAAAEEHIDLAAVLDMARAAPDLEGPAPAGRAQPGRPSVRIGVVRDAAFSFYYPENLEALQEAGAGLTFIDALHDPALPEVDALYVGGGFPEVFMDELAANAPFLQSIRLAVEGGLPIYAECGGLMFLARHITWQGRSAKMAGVLPCDVEIADRPQGHGYVLAEARRPHWFLDAGVQARGHEFHNSRLVDVDPELPTAYRLILGCGFGNGSDGLVYRNVLAGYTHLHAAGCPEWAPGLVARARGRDST